MDTWLNFNFCFLHTYLHIFLQISLSSGLKGGQPPPIFGRANGKTKHCAPPRFCHPCHGNLGISWENHDHFAKFSYASGLPGNLLSFSWEQHCSSWRRVWLPLNSTIVKWGTFQMASHWHATHLFIRATKTVFNAATTIAQIHHSGFIFIESSLFFFLNLSTKHIKITCFKFKGWNQLHQPVLKFPLFLPAD